MDPLDVLPAWMDRYKASQMIQLRALGYSQAEIAQHVGVSQQTVSRYLSTIHEAARGASNHKDLLLALVIVGAGAALFALLRSER